MSLLDNRLQRRLHWLVLAACVASVLESIGILGVYGLVRLVIEPEAIQSIPVVNDLMNFFSIQLSNSTLLIAAVLMALFYLAKNVFLAYVTYLQVYFSSLAGKFLSVTIFRRYMEAPYDELSMRNSGDLIVNVNHAPYFISTRILASAIYMVTEGLTILGIVGVLLYAEPAVAAITSLSLGAVMIIFYSIFRSFFARWGKETMVFEGEATKTVTEALRCIKEIHTLGCESFFQDIFDAARSKLVVTNSKLGFVGTLPRFVSETMIVWAISLVIVLIISSGRSDTELLTTLGLFGVAGFRLMPSINRLTVALATIKGGEAALIQVSSDLSTFAPINRLEPDDSPASNDMAFSQSLRLENMNFRYPGSSQSVLNNISVEITKGSFLGIVGGTGAGKTTLIDVILGLLQPQSGKVLLDSELIDTQSASWKRKIAYVPQDISLIDDSIRRNIALGISDENVDPHQIDQAVKLAAVSEMIMDLDAGLETIVGEQGVKLSGGQRQRIGIARALYRDAELIIMDEATSALDPEVEHEIVDTLSTLSGEKTIIIIAHRLSTVQHCDQLIMLEKGAVRDSGNFEQLRRRNSQFERMVQYAEITGGALDGIATTPATDASK